ncbi:MAG: carboxypeptidase regulatory-like domain-containing protein, partial [Acidobacteriaceae bacterium]|nr:carboxypeptidase regulatory-like domain-containing protein [Acidobacteriaceae bacterium]
MGTVREKSAGYRRLFFLLISLCIAAFCISTYAQEVTASITGQVTDPSGASIAGVKVTATDTQRGTQYTAETNSDGRYRLSNLLVGTYNVRAEHAGFQAATVTNITLELNQTAKLDFPLQVG